MKTLLSIIIAAALITLSGCVSVQERSATLQRLFPAWPAETIDCVARGCIAIGMNKLMVYQSVGVPPSWKRRTVTTPNGQIEIWKYGSPAYGIIYFQDGKVFRIWSF